MAPVRLLTVINSLEGGGAERNALLLLRHLDRSRFRPELLLLQDRIDQPKLIPPDVRVRSLHGSRPARFAYRAALLSHFLQKEGPDLILSFLEYSNLLVALSALLLGRRIRTVLSVRADLIRMLELTERTEGKRRAAFWRKMISILYPLADRVHVQAEEARSSLRRVAPRVSPGRCVVIPNPVEVECIRGLSEGSLASAGVPNEVPVIVFVGRLIWQKNVDSLLRAFARVPAARSAHLVLVGKGPDEPMLRELSRTLGIADRCLFAGFHPNPYPWFRRARVLVLPSRFEGFPTVLTEAMACALPVIATDCPTGPREIVVPGKTGFLVPPEDDVALTRAIDAILANPELGRRMGEHGRLRVADWDVSQIVPRFEQLLLTVMEGSRSRGSGPSSR